MLYPGLGSSDWAGPVAAAPLLGLLPARSFDPSGPFAQTLLVRPTTMSRNDYPSVGSHLVVTFPLPKVLQLRLNKPEALNAMDDNVGLEF